MLRNALFLCSLFLFPSIILSSSTVIPIHGEISPANAAFFKRSVSLASDSGSSHIIVDLDTFGGRVDSAIDISTTILGSPIPVTVFIRNQAWSAGALIALSSTDIYMAPGSTIGSATPVNSKSGDVLDEKYVSALRAKFKALAQQNNYNETLAQAMVDKSVNEDQKLVNLTAKDALAEKISKGTISNISDVLELLELDVHSVTTIEPSVLDKFAQLISKSAVSGVLISIGLLLLITEFRVAGGGVAGLIGIFCLSLAFGSQVIINYASVVELGLFILGVGLIAAEIFLIPGIGVFGFIGGGIILVALYLSFVPFTIPQTAWELEMSFSSLIIVLCSIAASMIGSIFIAGNVDRIPGLSRLALETNLEDSHSPTPEDKGAFKIGDRGVTIGELRPIGNARINGKSVQVISEQGAIEPGSPVEIVSLDGIDIIVAPLS